MAEKFMKIGGTDGQTAKALRTNQKGHMLTDTTRISKLTETTRTDFNGKKKGDLKVPNMAFEGSFTIQFDDDDRIMYPTPYLNDWEEFPRDESYELIYSDKDNRGKTKRTSVNGEMPFQLYKFNILDHLKKKGRIPATWTKKDLIIEDFEVYWRGYGVNGSDNGCNIHIWLPSRNRFSRLPRSHNSASSASLYLDSVAVGTTDVLDDEGNMYILARTSESVSNNEEARIVTNYIEVRNIKYQNEYIMTDLMRAYDDEKEALKVVDVTENHPAYDKYQDRIKVSVEESTLRDLLEEYIRFERQPTFVETLFDGELEPDEYVNNLYSRYRGEKETRILVSTDQEGFRMIVGAGPYANPDGFFTGTTYPDVYDYQKTHSEDAPLHILPIYKDVINVNESSWEEAYAHRQLNDFRISFRNTATSKANVKIKIMRIFK